MDVSFYGLDTCVRTKTEVQCLVRDQGDKRRSASEGFFRMYNYNKVLETLEQKY